MTVEAPKELPPINPHEAMTYLHTVVPLAGERLRNYFELGSIPHIEKGEFDFLTEADSSVDRFLIEKLKRRFPQSVFLTEESAPEDYSQLIDASNLWIIDPLDGTINFSRNNPQFGISIALVNKGIVDLGFIYLPMTDETITARSDEEFALLNGEPIHVSDVDSLNRAVFISDLPWEPEKRPRSIGLLNRLSQNVRFVKMTGSGVVEGTNIARGNIDGAVLTGSKPWDVAAAGLIIEKAGGKVTELDGVSWTPFSPTTLSSNGLLHEKVLEAFKKNSEEIAPGGKSNQLIGFQEAEERDPDFFNRIPEDDDRYWRLTVRHRDGRIEQLPIGTEWIAKSRFGSSRSTVVADNEGKPIFDSVKHEIPESVVIVAWGKDAQTGEIKVALINEGRALLDNPNEEPGHEAVPIEQIPMGYNNRILQDDGSSRLETVEEAALRELSEELGAGVAALIDFSYPLEPYMHVSVNIGGHPPDVIFAEIDLEMLGEINPEGGEQIGGVGLVTLKELLKRIRDGKSEDGYSRLATSNDAILIYLSYLSAFQNAERNEKLLSQIGEINKRFKEEDQIGYVRQMLRQSQIKHPQRYPENEQKAEIFLDKLT